MSEQHERIISALERIEQNQAKALQMQAEQIAMAREQMEKADARIKESLALQQLAVKRQARTTSFLLPIVVILVAMALHFAWKA